MALLPERDKSKNLGNLRYAFSFLFVYKLQLFIASLALLFTSGVTLGLGQGLRLMVDQGFQSGQLENLTRMALLFVGLAVLLGMGTFVRHYYVSWLGERTVADIRQHVFSKVINLHPGYFEHNLSGEIQTRITTDTTIIQNVIGSSASVALRNFLTLIGGGVMMVLTDAKLSLIVLVCVPLMVLPILFLGKGVRRLSRTTQDRMAKLGAFVGESIQHIKTVQAFNHQEYDRRAFDEVVESTFASARSRILYRSFLISIVMTSMLSAIAAILWIGGNDVINNRISAGQLVAFGFYAFLVALSLVSISEIFSELQKAAGATERLAELASTISLVGTPINPETFSLKCQGHLEIVSLDFSYPARPNTKALRGLSLIVEPGESLALVGPSGAGKTTLFDLILRYYDPQKGEILIDGINVSNLVPEDLRRQIAIVPQEAALFTTTVLENIRYSKPSATFAEIKHAADAAFALEFIEELPEGFDTFLGEKGTRLSGGQKQRIAIARAILKDPAILLLDEATSALDAQSEKKVQKALNALMKNRTTLIIAHRLATVRHVNRIAVLEGGQLIATGKHEELLKTNSLYKEFARLQFGSQEESA